MQYQYVFRSTGTYLGFISNGFLFSRDGEYLGWIDGPFAWDAAGKFRGQIWNNKYILTNRFRVQPIPRPPRSAPVTPALPDPPANITPIVPPTGWVDSF